MELLRSFISLFNRGERATRLNLVNLSIPVCYYGHTYVAQPNSDELKRAAFILESRNKNLTKHFSQLLSCYDEGTIILRDNSRQAVLKLEVRKVVVSGVDPKHQRLLAIVYDNDSSESSMGMECHIFLCRTKIAAKMSANKIGDKLNKLQIKSSEKLPPRVKLDEVNILTRPSVSEFDYENINKFFREEVFNLSVQEPSSESSSTYLTTGCDSGRASTVASVDMRSEEASRDFINPIEEGEESEVEINLDISCKVNPRVQQLLTESHVTSHENNKLNKQIRKQKDMIGPISSDVIGCSPLITDDSTDKDDQVQTVSASSDTIKCCPDGYINNAKESVVGGRFSGQYELTRARAKTMGDVSGWCNNNINDRYSHQWELTCLPGGKRNSSEDRYGRDVPGGKSYSTEDWCRRDVPGGKRNSTENRCGRDVPGGKRNSTEDGCGRDVSGGKRNSTENRCGRDVPGGKRNSTEDRYGRDAPGGKRNSTDDRCGRDVPGGKRNSTEDRYGRDVPGGKRNSTEDRCGRDVPGGKRNSTEDRYGRDVPGGKRNSTEDRCGRDVPGGKRNSTEDRYGRDVVSKKYDTSRKSKTELNKNKQNEDNRMLSEKLADHSDRQCIQNRYSVPYDEQDELLFNNDDSDDDNDDDDDVFQTHRKGNEDETLRSEMLSNSDITLRKIDKRDLHRLTYLSATDI